ncbi:nitroreductase family protein [Paenibacillus sp. MAH-36]|uniref:Putative NAD(P)H nitroreductase n=1 Tax=Paenibacillus violae TaxID=3077234 RepID=A0ABU3RLC1_9BACL|nr:nitroreductase [Paenibacillus sp. PFR10]MDU0205090.1 nitroreductase [Paenibacillus sp. PFR10]
MELKEAIRNRRSIGKVKQDPVDKALIEEILEAGTWAPNHCHTEPWRFWVMTGEGRGLLGKGYAEVAASEADPALTEEELAVLKGAQMKKAFRAPVVIAVAVTPSAQAVVPEIEEYAAAHAAVQNMLLTAHSLGLGAIWRTGAPTYHAKMREAFGLGAKEELVGFIYLGYPDMAPPPKAARTPFEQKTLWVSE